MKEKKLKTTKSANGPHPACRPANKGGSLPTRRQPSPAAWAGFLPMWHGPTGAELDRSAGRGGGPAAPALQPPPWPVPPTVAPQGRGGHSDPILWSRVLKRSPKSVGDDVVLRVVEVTGEEVVGVDRWLASYGPAATHNMG
jgi:hypothetical protein